MTSDIRFEGGHIRMIGLEETLQNLKEVEPLLAKNAIRSAVAQMAADTRNDARSRVPQDTGNLRRNIASRRARGQARHQYNAVVFVREERGERVMSRSEWRRERFKQAKEAIKNAFYWRFVEYGTKYMPARPFLRPAFERLRATFPFRFHRVVKAKFDVALAKLEAKARA